MNDSHGEAAFDGASVEATNGVRFLDKVILVTGGSSGIGHACAEVFARERASVVIVARDPARGADVATQLTNKGLKCQFIAADLCKREDIKKIFQVIESRYGGLDVAINNAGIDGASFTTIGDYPEDVWDTVINLNLTSVWLCMRHEIRLMRDRRGAAIVNVASVAGLRASLTGGCAYTAAKHGVVGLTKSAALECAKDDIRVNAVCPAIVNTPMAQRVLGGKIDLVKEIHPLGRVCEAEEVANAVAWLCSLQSSFITGTALPVDGGVMAK